MNQITERLNEMNEYIRNEYMPFVYSQLMPSVEEQNNEDWWRDTFLEEAVNSENYDFQECWDNYVDYNTDGVVIVPEVYVIVEMINKNNEWCMNALGEKWSYDNLTYEKIFKMYAYAVVMEQGLDYWMEQKDRFNEYVENHSSDDEDAESVEEEYNGSKDFPPNETDDVCPICFEEYTPSKMRDGIRNSEYKSRCPHYCCIDCWINIYNDESNTKKRCPICRANVSKWLEDNHQDFIGVKKYLMD